MKRQSPEAAPSGDLEDELSKDSNAFLTNSQGGVPPKRTSLQSWDYFKDLLCSYPELWNRVLTQDMPVQCSVSDCPHRKDNTPFKTMYTSTFLEDIYLCKYCFSWKNRYTVVADILDDTIEVDLVFCPLDIQKKCKKNEISESCHRCKNFLYQKDKDLYWSFIPCLCPKDNKESCKCASHLLSTGSKGYPTCFECNEILTKGVLTCSKCENELKEEENEEEWFVLCDGCKGERDDPGTYVGIHLCPGARPTIMCDCCAPIFGGLGNDQMM